jgi:serine/threonine protein kinase
MLEKIGKYKIIDKIGTGAMGVVYKGFDTKMGRYVAIKTMSPQYVNNDESRSRFYREAIAPAKLFHPNIVSIYDLDEEEGTPFIVMEFLDGLDLKYFRTAKINFSIPQILNIMAQVAHGLDYAHKNDIVHRDVKPANIILLKNGIIKILDFGIARVMVESTFQTRTGVAMGTPAYMSPEQARGQKVDARTDQYALGVIAYELLTGKNPFQAENYTGVLYNILHITPPPLSEAVPDCPPELNQAVIRILEKDRDKRYPDLRAVVDICKKILAGYSADAGRLELAIKDLDNLDTAALKEPYKVRLIRKYIKEFQFEAASRLLDKLKTEAIDATVLASLRTELANQSLKKRCSDLIRLGQDLIDNGDYDLALANFNEVLKLDPENVDAITSIQKARRLQKEKLFKDEIQPLLEEAAQNSQTGDYLGAIEKYQKILALDPEYVEAKEYIRKNEELLARANQVRLLLSDIQHSVHSAEFEEAFKKQNQLEELAPRLEQTTRAAQMIWQKFSGELSAYLDRVTQKDGLRGLRDWMRGLFADGSLLSYLSMTGHQDEKNHFLKEIRASVTRLMQAQHLDEAHVILEIVQPAFPRDAQLNSLATEVVNLKQSITETRQRRLAMEQQLLDGVQEVRQSLESQEIQEATRIYDRLSRQFSGETVLADIKEEIDATRQQIDEATRIGSQVERIQQLLQVDKLDVARSMLEQLEREFPHQSNVKSLRTQLAEKERALQQRSEKEQFLHTISSLRDLGKLDQAIETARKAMVRFPDHTEFRGILEDLQSRKVARDRQEEIHQKVEELRSLLPRNMFLSAGKIAYDLKNRYPDNPAVIEALQAYHEKRYEFITGAIQAAQSFSSTRAFEEARNLLERAIKECPDSIDLQDAQQQLVVAEEVNDGMAEAKRSLTEKKYDLALATLEGLLARYPEETNLVRLYTDIRTQRNNYIKENIQHARTFVAENDYDRALSLLRTAQEIVPNAMDIQDEIEEISRQRDAYYHQRKEAAEEARLMEKEVERAIAESKKYQSRGNLFDALRVLEETRQRFPRSASRLEGFIQEVQESINLQMDLPELSIPAEVLRRRRLPVYILSGLLLVVVAVVLVMILIPSEPPVPPQPDPAVLVVDLKPWGEITELVNTATGEAVSLDQITTPLKLSLPPGQYRLSYRFSDEPNGNHQMDLSLAENDFRQVQEVSPVLKSNLDATVEELFQ